MYKFLQNISLVTKSFIRIVSLKNVRHYFNKTHYTLLSCSLLLNMLNSLCRLATPAAFGRALEMLAKSEENMQFAGLNLTYAELIYISISLSIWLRYEDDLKELLMLPFTNTMTEKISLELSMLAHELPLNEHSKQRNEINNAFLKTQNHCVRLLPETVFSIYPGIMDIIIGVTFTFNKYGGAMGGNFVAFILVNLFIANNLLSKVLQVNERNVSFDRANHLLLTHEFEMLLYEEMVRIHNKNTFEIFQTRHFLKELSIARKRKVIANSVFNIATIIPLALANILLVYYLNLENLNSKDIDDAVLLLGYFTTIGSNLIRLNRSFHISLNALSAFDELEQLLKQRMLLPNIIVDYFLPTTAFKFDQQPSIEFVDVSFSYEQGKPILKNLSFHILPGSFVGIAGRSGSGKSTIIKLLFRLFDPENGVIKINGIDIKQLPISMLRNMIAYIPSVADIFQNESLLFNVLYGADEKYLKSLKSSSENKSKSKQLQINEESVLTKSINTENNIVLKEASALYKRAMGQAKLEKFIKHKHERNVQMSTGQQQQLNLARGLAKQSSIFVFDELTAPLDSFSEQEVLKTVHKLSRNKTTLMIAHRLSTIKNADNILVIEDGTLVEQGMHHQLLNSKGKYYDYCRLQCM